MFLRQRKLKSYARIRNAENITKRLYLVNHMRSYMQRKIYKNNCPSSVEYHVECVFVFGSFFRHLWNISSNDYLKWFSTGKPKGQEKILPLAILRCGKCFKRKHKNREYVIKHEIANSFCVKSHSKKFISTATNMWK